MTVTTPLPARASRPPLLRLVPSLTEPVDLGQEPLPLPDAALPLASTEDVDADALRAARTLAMALVEVLAGRRPASQLRPALTPRVALLIEHLVRSGCAQGMRLAGLRAQSPKPGAVEVTARLSTPHRSGAIALRVEKRTTRWVVGVLEAALTQDGRWPARS